MDVRNKPKKTFDLCLRNVTQAYTQSVIKLNRNIYARPPKEMNLPDNFLPKINGPLYVIPESETHWYRTYIKHHTENLKMRQSTYDLCLHQTSQQHNAFELLGLQMDDTIFV